MVVQLLVAALKFSLISVTEDAEFEVAEEVKLIGAPEQTVLALADAVTEVGIGFTANVFDEVSIPQEPPDDVNVSVTVPVKEEGGVYVAFSVVELGVKDPPTPPSDQVPPVAVPPTLPPNAAEVPP